jgi:enoyl-CoA hydratase
LKTLNISSTKIRKPFSKETYDSPSCERIEKMSDVLVRVSGACGRITLNRPRALNALTLEMVDKMHTTLMAWASEESIQFVLVDGAGERGLCAGGDIRAMYTAVINDAREVATEFFRKEYRLNYLISRYPKPYVVLMDGIVMGGGIGISAHASHRIVTERSELAMSETAIGFVPDVGVALIFWGLHPMRSAPTSGSPAVGSGRRTPSSAG